MNQGLKSQDRQFKKTATHNTDFVGSKLFGSALVVTSQYKRLLE